MNIKQKAVLLGMVLGDAYLQKTGKKNARIRLEHGEKQREYLFWKAGFFPEFFQGKPEQITRYNHIFNKTYHYVRWQSNASPEIGKYQRLFYINGKKTIPQELPILFTGILSLAVWYMDDGYLYKRDKTAYIYLSKINQIEQQRLLETLQTNFGLRPILKEEKRGNLVLVFPVKETTKLLRLVKPYIINSLEYKLLDPVSTEA